MKNKKRFFASALLWALFAGSASTVAAIENSTAAGAVPYEVGQGWVSHYVDETNQNRWFTFGEMAGHSYCIEAVQGSVSTIQLDPNIALYSDSSGSATLNVSGVPIANNDAAGDPHFIKGARACYIAQAPDTSTVIRSFKVSVPVAVGSGGSGFVKLRVVNTTLQAPCFARVHPSFSPPSLPSSEAANLTGAAIAVSSRMLGTGVVSAPFAATIGANSVIGVGPMVTQTGYYGHHGRCLIAHNGPPGALVGYSSTLDSPTGTTYKYEFKPR